MSAKEETGKVLSTNAELEYVHKNFVKLKVNLQTWTSLWRDPATGQFWKKYSPYPEMHGGGPPEFIAITEEQAIEEFGPIR